MCIIEIRIEIKEVPMVNRMKQLREEKGLNMKDVAKALGMPYTTYVNHEKELVNRVLKS